MRFFLCALAGFGVFASVRSRRPLLKDSYLISYEDAPNGEKSPSYDLGGETYEWYAVVDPAATFSFRQNIQFGTTGKTLADVEVDNNGVVNAFEASNDAYVINSNLPDSKTYSWYIYGVKKTASSSIPVYDVSRISKRIGGAFVGGTDMMLLNAAAPYYFTLSDFGYSKAAAVEVYTTSFPTLSEKYKVFEIANVTEAEASVINIFGPLATVVFRSGSGETIFSFEANVGDGTFFSSFGAGGAVTIMSPGWSIEGESFASMGNANFTFQFQADAEISSDIQIDFNQATGSDSLTVGVSGPEGAIYTFIQKGIYELQINRTFAINVTAVQSSPDSQFLATIYTSKISGGSTLSPRTTTTPPTIYCPAGYNPLVENCVKFVIEIQSYDVAELMCREDGGHLVSIHSQQENDALGSFAAQYGFPVFFTGLQSFAGFRSWSDGSPYDYNNFGAGFPNDSDGICVQFSLWRNEWESVTCENKLQYVCATTRLTGK